MNKRKRIIHKGKKIFKYKHIDTESFIDNDNWKTKIGNNFISPQNIRSSHTFLYNILKQRISITFIYT